jgi:hypothetical protein
VNAVNTYTAFLRIIGGKTGSPRYSYAAELPFISTEAELDALKLKWIDVDFESAPEG